MALGVRNPGYLPNILARVEETRRLLMKPDLDPDVRQVTAGLLALAITQNELNKRLWEGKKGIPEPHRDSHVFGDDAIGGALGGHGLNLIPTRTVSTSVTMNADDWLVRANASGGALTVTLPPTSDRPGRLVAVSKVDETLNLVTIQASGGNTVAGDISFDLCLESEVLSLISDEASGDWTVV